MLLQSTNGTTWEQVDSGTSNALFFASGQNGVFIVGGTNGMLRTGEQLDGFQTRLSHTTNALLATAFGNSLHVVVGARGTLLSSEDGVTWTPRFADTTNDLRGKMELSSLWGGQIPFSARLMGSPGRNDHSPLRAQPICLTWFTVMGGSSL